MIKAVLLLAALSCFFFVAVQGAELKIKNCPGPPKRLGTIKKLDITGCSAYPCTLIKGTNVTLKLDIHMNGKVNGLKHRIAGNLAGKEVPFSAPETDLCKLNIKEAGAGAKTKEGQSKCPLLRNKLYTYEYSIEIKKVYPKVSLSVQYDLTNEKGQSIVCFQMAAMIRDGIDDNSEDKLDSIPDHARKA